MIRELLERTGFLIRIKKIYYAVEARVLLPRTKALFGQMCGADDLVFDVGANLGQKTQIFLSLGARVISIEPERRCCEYIARRFRSSGRVTVLQAAVSDTPGRMQLFVNPQTPEISTLDLDWLRTGPDKAKAGRIEEQTVEVVTLTQLIERYGQPDYVKIDVEGFETRVLQGLTVPVRALSFEYHVENPDDLAERCRIVDALGDYRFNYTRANTCELALTAWVSSTALIDSIRTTPDAVPRWGDVFARRRIASPGA